MVCPCRRPRLSFRRGACIPSIEAGMVTMHATAAFPCCKAAARMTQRLEETTPMDRRTLLISGSAALAGLPAFSAFAARTEPGVTDKEVLLGQSAVLSGPLA